MKHINTLDVEAAGLCDIKPRDAYKDHWTWKG